MVKEYTLGISKEDEIRNDFKEFLILNNIEHVAETTDISVKKLNKFKKRGKLSKVHLERLKAYLTIY